MSRIIIILLTIISIINLNADESKVQTITEYDMLRTEVSKLSRELALLQKQFYRNYDNNDNNLSPDQQVTLEEMDQQIRALNGKLEVYENKLKQVNARLDKAFLDIEFRLNKLEQLAVALPLPDNKTLAERKMQGENLDLSNLDIEKNKLEQYKQEKSESSKPNATKVSEAPKQVLNKEQEKKGQLLYNQALAMYRQSKFSDAIKSFEKFINEYPTHTMSTQALFWLGEVYYALSRYEYASIQYIKNLQKDYTNPKAAEAQFKLVISLNKLGKTKQACSYLEKLKTDFADSFEQFKLKKEYSELSQLKCDNAKS